MKTFKRSLIATTVFALVSTASLTANASTNSQANWQPVASEKLITLPANIIEKKIQQDFRASAMANHIANIESQMGEKAKRIKALKEVASEASGEELINAKYESVQQKSDYLDLLQESNTLRQQALDKKLDLYQQVLTKLRRKEGKVSEDAIYQLKQKQQAAKARMESVMKAVDANLAMVSETQPSKYQNDFAKNLAKIEQLKSAIARHSANASPSLNGVELTSEEYVRHLLAQASSEQSLLDQEALMLSYMAKLVALDAQALEYDIAYNNPNQSENFGDDAKPLIAAELFIEEF